MKHHVIELKMQKIAQPLGKKVEVIWNDVIDRWQVYEITYGRLMTLNGHKRNLRLLWTIQTENGSYRNPIDADLQRMLLAADHSRQLWNTNVDTLADQLEADEREAARQVHSTASGKLKELSKVMASLGRRTTTVQNPRAWAEAAARDIMGASS